MTSIAKNYRPIACLNIMYKLYTSCLNNFLCDHCESNNIITPEQAGGKKGVWGTTEQLLLNKTILKEVKSKKRNLYTVWLDYRKAFDSVPHQWLIRALKLAKVPNKIINAIQNLTRIWSTNLYLQGSEEVIVSDIIEFLRGIFQGNSLSVVLFNLSVNPLSFLLRNLKGYAAGTERFTNITHNFFVDDLKLYGSTLNNIKKLLDIATTFSRDIGMQFGIDKCADININNGKQTICKTPLEMNGLVIQPVAEEDTYRYLGQDENIEYVGHINKDRVTKELYSRCRKIWSSELSSYNKTTAHNTFAVSVILPTFGILDWTIEEIKNTDIKIRKILSMNGSFHPNSDVDRLYISRKKGGGGLKSIQTTYENRIVSLRQHLELNKDRNPVMTYVYQHEQSNSMRAGEELLNKYNTVDNTNDTPKVCSKKFNNEDQAAKLQRYENKAMHGYIHRKLTGDTTVDKALSQLWLRDKYMTSHFKAYACAIQEQEIATKYLIHKRQRDNGITPSSDNKCRLCRTNIEDITHIISACPLMSTGYYLPLRHDQVGKIIYKEHVKKHTSSSKVTLNNEPEYIYKHDQFEYWWNISIQTSTKLPHNKPDLVIWNKDAKTCTVIDFSCPSDVNVTKKVTEKIDNYGPLLRNLQMMYREYKFEMVPIIVGALGYVPTCLKSYIQQLGFDEKESIKLIRKLQAVAVSGTVKIVKRFLGFKS